MCHICLLGPLIVSSLLTGVTGETHVFSSSSENVALPCNNALSGCTSTTWIYYYIHRSSGGVELFAGGIKKNDIKRAERLSLGSDCSLNIYKTTEDDRGQYICQQYVNEQKHGTDAQIFLHVLHLSPSSTQTEMRSGSSVTLTCQLFTFDNNCDDLIRIEDLQLFWVNQADVNLQTDSRYQILSSGQCIKTLTTTLLNEDNNTEWRCLVKKKNEIKTSVSFTVKFKDITTKISQQKDSSTPVIVICAVFSALAVILAAVLYKKRADNRRKTDSSVVKDKNDYKGTYETINISKISKSPTPSTNEQTNEVTYCEITASSKQQIKKNKVHCDDKVTYATIKGANVTPQDDFYASLN
ncbi:uncharacterized protein [Paramisgurnus dabryanus]|uniref:uncharacterized protein n=1 Tax=Paramisgurnus dabryanus TaxID=90735 RepID=UPI0031F3FDB2